MRNCPRRPVDLATKFAIARRIRIGSMTLRRDSEFFVERSQNAVVQGGRRDQRSQDSASS